MRRHWPALAALLLLPCAGWSWSATGHMLVAQIAYDRLDEVRRHQLEALAAALPGKHGPYNAVTAACWLDDTKTPTTGPWHYVDAPYTADGESFTEPDGDDALRAMARALATLHDRGAAKEAHVKALGVVVHLVGDLHQPMHCVERDNDRGGNEVKLHGVPGERNLHALWDGAYRFDEAGGKVVRLHLELPHPDAPGEGKVKERADEVATAFPEKDLAEKVKQLDPLVWAKESHKLACTHGYAGLVPDGPAMRPGPGYIHRAHRDACCQIALAGYRLAAVLRELLPG